MKKTLTFFLAIAMLLSTMSSFNFALADYDPVALTLDYSLEIREPGDSIDLSIVIAPNNNVLTGKFEIFFDSDVIDQPNITSAKGTLIRKCSFQRNNNTDGRYAVGFVGTTPQANAGGELCSFVFPIRADATADTANLNVVVSELIAEDTSTLIENYFTDDEDGDIDFPIHQEEQFDSVEFGLATDVVEVSPFGEFDVAINVSENSKLGSATLNMTYDTNSFEYISFTPGAILSDEVDYSANCVQSAGQALVTVTRVDGQLLAAGEIGSLRFKVLEEPVGGNHNFTLAINGDVLAYDGTTVLEATVDAPTVSVAVDPESTFNWVTFYAFDGVTVLDRVLVEDGDYASTAVELPLEEGCVFAGWDIVLEETPIYEDTQVYSQYMLLGDANGDGVLNTGDAATIFAYVLDGTGITRLGLAPADVNADGEINTGDTAMLLRYFVYLVAELPQH